MRFCKAFLIPLVCALTACSAPETRPRPDRNASEFFTTLYTRIVNEGKSYRFAVALRVDKPVNGEAPWFVKLDYEDPSNPSAHLIQTGKVAVKQGPILIHSPVFARPHNNKTYSIRMQVFADPDMTRLITTHPLEVRVDLGDPVMAIIHLTGGENTHPPRDYRD